MSSKSIIFRGKTAPSRSQTQRKITKIQFGFDNLKFIRKSQVQYKKSLSNRKNSSKYINRRYIKQNKLEDIKISVSNSKNIKLGNENNSSKVNSAKKSPHTPFSTQKKLKTKKSNQAQQKNHEINGVDKNLNNEQKQEKKANQKLKQLMKNPQSQMRRAVSKNLESTNFEDKNLIEQRNSQNIKSNNLIFSSLRQLKMLKRGEKERIQKRKRIQSCRFVVNPFRKIKQRGQRNDQCVNPWDLEDHIFGRQFGQLIDLSQISEIEQIPQIFDYQNSNQSIQILQLINE